MKIIVDAFGGDNAPEAIVNGAIDALAEGNFRLVLAGDPAKLETLLNGREYDETRVEILNAPDVIGMEDDPVSSVRKRKNSSIVMGLNALQADEEAAAFVSAGSTGAVLTGAVLLTKRIHGVRRPALCPVLPSLAGGNVLLVDCGANAECKASDLVQFARMGAAYAKRVLRIKNVRVALLNNGTEDTKGAPLQKEAFGLLKESGLNFVGNFEGRDLLGGGADVIVSDGYSGNIALKSMEGVANGMFSLIKEGIMSGGMRAKLGYLLLKPVLKTIKKKMDYNENGGAVLLGLQKIVVKAHGSTKAKSFKAAVLQAVQLAESGLQAEIEEEIGRDVRA